MTAWLFFPCAFRRPAQEAQHEVTVWKRRNIVGYWHAHGRFVAVARVGARLGHDRTPRISVATIVHNLRHDDDLVFVVRYVAIAWVVNAADDHVQYGRTTPRQAPAG